MQQRPMQPPDYSLKETSTHLGDGRVQGGGWMTNERSTSTYDLVEQMQYLYVRVEKARELPAKGISGGCDPYVEVCLGNYKGTTKHFEKKTNPKWHQVFSFSKERIQSTMVEVIMKDKDLVKDDFIGRVAFDLNEVPTPVPPHSPLAPQWYHLEDREGSKIPKGEVMLAVWMGTQADEAFQEAWHSDAATVHSEGLANIGSKFAHRKCMQCWCNEKGDTTCEICHQLPEKDYWVNGSKLIRLDTQHCRGLLQSIQGITSGALVGMRWESQAY